MHHPMTRSQILKDFRLTHPALNGCVETVVRATRLVVRAHQRGGLVLACGNGGSSADAAHIVGELVKGFALARTPERRDLKRLSALGPEWKHLAPRLQGGIRAVALGANDALASAIINDQHPDLIYAQQVYALAGRSDVVIGLSTSGSSANVVRALQVARMRGAATIAFTGSRAAPMHDWADVSVQAPETLTHRVQEQHLPLYHLLCLLVEEQVFGR